MMLGIDKLRMRFIGIGALIALAGMLALATTARAEDCGNGVELKLSAPDAALLGADYPNQKRR